MEMRQTSDSETVEAGQVAITYPTGSRLSLMEQLMVLLQQKMQQQMQLQTTQKSMLERLEQRFSAEDDRKQRMLETGKNKVQDDEEPYSKLIRAGNTPSSRRVSTIGATSTALKTQEPEQTRVSPHTPPMRSSLESRAEREQDLTKTEDSAI